MALIGVKELKAKTSYVLRSLREKKESSFLITLRGKPVARLLPISDEDIEDAIMALDNPKFKAFIGELKKQPSVSWEEIAGGAQLGKTPARGKKAG